MKRRLGLTQRVDDVPERGESRDALDQRWTVLLEACGFVPVPLCNRIDHTADYLEALELAGVIITGGNDVTFEQLEDLPMRDRFEHAVLTYCWDRRIPVLGVCRGMQIMNVFFKGRLSTLSGHVASRHRVSAGAQRRDVNSYHNFGICPGDLGAGLIATAFCDDGSIEAMRHPGAPFHGLMWHPEREEPADAMDVALLEEIFRGVQRC